VTPETRLLRPGDAAFPGRLLELAKPPVQLAVAGEMTAAPTFAVVGTRKPTVDAFAFARDLARAIVEHGGIVASGGAVGIDAAAHEGALEAGGVTWVVAATGRDEVFPPENAPLFAHVLERGGVMIWPFEDGKKADPRTFFTRNGVLVALADALVIVQAGVPSGTLNAARWARRLGRPVWAVCAPPWVSGFLGCASVVELGARPLVSTGGWLRAVGLVTGRRRTPPVILSEAKDPAVQVRPSFTGGSFARLRRAQDDRGRTPEELAILETLSPTKAQHIDEIAAKSGLSAQGVATALLTLALEDVLVEGPEGQFRLASSR
jgi:DNA processing protein